MKKLTEQQEIYLDALFGEAKGDFSKAKEIAGYTQGYSIPSINRGLSEEIERRTREFLSSNGPKAAFALKDVIDNPKELGNTVKLAATKDLLDRIGFSKTEKVEVKTDNPLFILPIKKNEEDLETTETPEEA